MNNESTISGIQKRTMLRRRSSLGQDAEEFEHRQKDLGLHKSQWQTDEEAIACRGCKKKFTMNRRRHHCRECGQVFCGRCSAFQVVINGEMKRACRDCYIQAANRKTDGEIPFKGQPGSADNSSGKTPQFSGTVLLDSQQAPGSAPTSGPPPSISILHSGEKKPTSTGGAPAETVTTPGGSGPHWFESIMFERSYQPINKTIRSIFPVHALSQPIEQDIHDTIDSIRTRMICGHIFFRVRDKAAPGFAFRDDNDEVVGTAVTTATQFWNCYVLLSNGTALVKSHECTYTQSITLVSRWPFQHLANEMLHKLREAIDLQTLTQEWRRYSSSAPTVPPALLRKLQAAHDQPPPPDESTHTDSEEEGGPGGGHGGEGDGSIDVFSVTSVLEVAMTQVLGWPAITPGSLAYLTFFGEMLHCVVSADLSLGDINPRLTTLLAQSNLVELLAPLGLVQHIWALWEMLITGQDIVILATHPLHASRLALALASLLEPLGFVGDLRPFMRPEDRDLLVLAATAQLKVVQRTEEAMAAQPLAVTETAKKLAARNRSIIVGVCDPDALAFLDDFSVALFVDSTQFMDELAVTLRFADGMSNHMPSTMGDDHEFATYQSSSGEDVVDWDDFKLHQSDLAFTGLRNRNTAETKHLVISYTSNDVTPLVVSGKRRSSMSSFFNRKASHHKYEPWSGLAVSHFTGLYRKWLEEKPTEGMMTGGRRAWLVYKTKPTAFPLHRVLRRIQRLHPEDRLVFGDKILRDSLLDITKAFLDAANDAAAASAAAAAAATASATASSTSDGGNSLSKLSATSSDRAEAALESLNRRRSIEIAHEAEAKGMWRMGAEDLVRWLYDLPQWMSRNVATVLLWVAYLMLFGLLAIFGVPPVIIVVAAFIVKIPDRPPASLQGLVDTFLPMDKILRPVTSTPSLNGDATPMPPSLTTTNNNNNNNNNNDDDENVKPDLSGVWKRVKVENYEAFLGAQGAGYMQRKLASSVAMQHTISMDPHKVLLRLQEKGGPIDNNTTYPISEDGSATVESKAMAITFLDSVTWDRSYQTPEEVKSGKRSWKLLIHKVRLPDRPYELRVWRWLIPGTKTLRLRAVYHPLSDKAGSSEDIESFCSFEYISPSPHTLATPANYIPPTSPAKPSQGLTPTAGATTPISGASGNLGLSLPATPRSTKKHKVDFSGTWVRTRAENFEAFAAASGASYIQRKLAAQMILTHVITMNIDDRVQVVRLQERGGPLNTDFTVTLKDTRDVPVMMTGRRMLHRAYYIGYDTLVMIRRAEDGSFEHVLSRTLDAESSAEQPHLVLRSLHRNLKTGVEVEAVSFFTKQGPSPNPPPTADPEVRKRLEEAGEDSDENGEEDNNNNGGKDGEENSQKLGGSVREVDHDEDDDAEALRKMRHNSSMRHKSRISMSRSASRVAMQG